MRSNYGQVTSEIDLQLLAFDVLIVDENSDDLKSHAELLETLGLTVFRCDSYQAAIYSILQGRSFDLAVVDQGSAAFEGRVVLRCLKPVTPFVVLTRNHRVDCHRKAMGLGAADYLEKPISFAQVSRVFRSLEILTNRSKECQSGDAA